MYVTPRQLRPLYGLVEIVVVFALLWALPAIAAAQPTRFGWPLAPPVSVLRGFDVPEQRWQPGHRGVDLGSSAGASVRSAGDGTVQFVGEVAGRPLVSIRHADDLITTYEPVHGSVGRGQEVRRGEVIGVVMAGHPGCPVAACLHWGARRGRGHDAVYLDPRALLGAVRVRLKPLDGASADAALRRVDAPAGAPPAGAPH
ncbi:M23 family metallopeptidase [Gordonia sp. NPDC003424]